MTETADTAKQVISPGPVDEKQWKVFLKQFFSSGQAVVGFTLLVLVAFACVFGSKVVPQNPYDLSQVTFMDSLLPPGDNSSGGFTHWLGTDAQGRDMLSVIVYGLRLSVIVAASATSIAFLIGITLGLVSGYFGGIVDTIIMRIADMQVSIPALLSALVVMAVAGPGVGKLIISIVIVYWAHFARLVRASALVERRKEYIEAAICLALPRYRIVLRHMLINSLSPVIVLFTILIAQAVLLESTLSFLGIGVPVTEPSLGLLISNGFGDLMSGRYWVALFPGLMLVILTFAVNLVGDRLRDILNPKLAD